MSALYYEDSTTQALGDNPQSEEQYPCSLAQQRFWILEQLDPGNPALNVAVRWRLEGHLPNEALEEAWRVLLDRHASLRTYFDRHGGEPIQVVSGDIAFAIPIIDLSRWDEIKALCEAERLARQEARASFNISVPPLMRVTRVKLPRDVTMLLVTIHHLICDGWSIGILAREMGEICAALQQDRKPRLSKLEMSYGEYAQWQREWLAAADFAAADAYWKRSLEGLSYFEIRPDRSRPPLQTSSSDIQSKLLERPVSAALVGLACRNGCTLYMAAVAALLVMLHRHSGEVDIAIGTQLTGRDEVELEDMVGLFINTLLLRVDLSGDPSFAEVLARVRTCVTEAFEHQQMPFERLIELINPRRDLSRNALFSVNFIFQRSFIVNADYGGFRLIDQPSFSAGAFYDLNFFMVERPEGWRISCEYNTDLFDNWTIQGLLGSWEILLRAVSAAQTCPLSILPLLSAEDRGNLIEDRNRTQRDYPHEMTFIELLEAQSHSRADQAGVICGTESLTYAELDRRSNQLARELQRWSLAPGRRVGVLLERSPDLLVALLAVMKAGSAYVPLDPAFPRDRLAYVAQDAALSGLITHSGLRRLIDDVSIPAIELDSHAASIEGQRDQALPKTCAPEDLAYVIYTSGSTGMPKGVQIRHRSLVNLLSAMTREPGLSERDTLVAITTVCFDIAALELYLPLLVGARLVIAKESEVADGQALWQLLKEHGATVLQATPARWQVLVDAGWNGDPPLKMLCGGDVLTPRLAAELLSRGGELWNLYGPTETTIWSSALRIESCEGQIPIGPPIANTQFYVLDENQEVLPAGATGELFIGGEGVASGYWGQPELTEQRFLPDKFSGGHGAKLYRTGDLVRWRSDGRLEFLGRADRQIKLRGYRIEPAEIEAVLCRHPDVAEAVVVSAQQPSGEVALLAYIVPRQGSSWAPASLVGMARSLLQRFLPEYMLPNSIQIVESLPQSPSGKIDRRSLPPSKRQSEPASPSRPLTRIEQRLTRIWAAILGTEDISLTADFFELGGNSVLAARLLARIAAEFGRTISLAALFKAPTVEGIARLLQREQRALDFHSVVKLHANGTKPAIVAINNTGIFYELSKELGADQPFTALQTFDLPYNAKLPVASFEDIAGDYARLIRQVQPDGPYVLLGWCVGGALAYETAQQLQRAGQEVSHLILIDCWIPGYLRRMPRALAVLAEFSYRVKMFAWHARAMASGRQSLPDFLAKRRLLRRIVLPFASAREKVDLGNTVDGLDSSPQSYDERLLAHLTNAAQSYELKPYSGSVLLLRSQQQPTGFLLDESLGWSSYVIGSIEIGCVAGDHFTMFRHPGVEHMARRIAASLGKGALAGSPL